MADRDPGIVLVAEDDDGVRQLIEAALHRTGHTTLSATDGREAMRILKDHDQVVDVLVSDINMPGVGGFELFAFARSKRPDLSVILASGTKRSELPPEWIDADVTLLEKPFSLAELLGAIEHAFGATRSGEGHG